jgi:hypothetical protein
MASAVPMSRSRGSLSGLALILLGAWGGLAPFIGPYFQFGFQPDKAWVYSSGRLYLSIVPGAVVLLTGLIVATTRSRSFGGLCALIAALGGAWFALGQVALTVVAGNALTYSPGSPIGGSLARITLSQVGSYAGVGVLIVFFAALALGRQSISAHKDHVKFGDQSGQPSGAGAIGVAGGGLASVGLSPTDPLFDPYPPTQASPTTSTSPQSVVGGGAQFPNQYPANQDPYGQDPFKQEQQYQPTAQTGYPDSFDPYGAGPDTYGPGTVTYSPGQTRYPPTQFPSGQVQPGQEQTNSMTAPTEEQQFPPAQR